MNYTYSRYTENLPEEFSIRHKRTENTEKKNFHLHKQLEIIYALSGNLKCKFETGVVSIPKNGMILLNPMNLHYIFPEEGSGICDRFVLYFSSNYISYLSTPEVNLLECFLINQSGQPVVLSVPEEQTDRFMALLNNMETCHSSDTPASAYGKDLHTKLLLGQFLLLTNQLYFQQFGRRYSISFQNHSQLVYDICEYIGNHYNTPLTTEEIARHFLISKTQLYYIFKEVSGITVSEYITQYRITKAKDLLINTDYSIEMISEAVGYMNISSFSRLFKMKAGCSPLQYRKSMSSYFSHCNLR